MLTTEEYRKDADCSTLTKGTTLVNSTLWNLAGQFAPLAVAVVAIPVLINRLGPDRFGILTLAWMIVGYFGLFDLGLGRALTNIVAQNFGKGDLGEIGPLIWTANVLLVILGGLGMLLMAVTSPFLVKSILKVPRSLIAESLVSFELLSLSVPIVIVTSGFRGALEGCQKFAYVNYVRIPLGVLMYGAPLIAVSFTSNLSVIVAILCGGRLLACAAYFYYCHIAVPGFRVWRFDRKYIARLLSFGSWMTLSNLISPLMVYMDRLFIGAIVSVAAVAYYATPYEVATKLLLVPAAVVAVLFPAFATSLTSEKERASTLFHQGVVIIYWTIFPVAGLLFLLAPAGLRVWLGSDFAAHSIAVFRVLLVGVFINCMAQVPFAFIQGAGRPDITAKIHLIEVPIYLCILCILLRRNGIEGAAIAWLVRATVDAAVLLFFCYRAFTEIRKPKFLKIVGLIFVSEVCLLSLALPLPSFWSFLAGLTLIVTCEVFVWRVLMNTSERLFLLSRLRFLNRLQDEA